MDLLGVGELFYDPTLGGDSFISEWINLRDKDGHKVGCVLLELTYHPKKESIEKFGGTEIHNMNLTKLSRPLGDANELLDNLPDEVGGDESLWKKEDFMTPTSE